MLYFDVISPGRAVELIILLAFTPTLHKCITLTPSYSWVLYIVNFYSLCLTYYQKKIDDSTNAHHIEALKEHEQLTQIPFALLIQLPSSSTFATPFTTPSSSPFFLPLSGEESANNGRVKLL